VTHEASPAPARDPSETPEAERAIDAAHVRQVRLGHGANCSSIGSVVDTLFATAAVGAAVFAAVVAALGREEVTIAGDASPGRGPDEDDATGEDR
jgi:hypothetical protein